MNDRYVAKVVSVVDDTTVVINIGAEHGIRVGQTYLVVGLGEKINDPDTGETLEQLELVRGRVAVVHIQQKISTLTSTDIQRDPDTRQIKRSNHGAFQASLFGSNYATTELITAGIERTKPLTSPKIGDYIIED
ncbi:MULTISPECIES: FlgT C-terminal domain-containing protein [Pseudomonas syringae group]|uniref:FlgT C-terminal domain-containing protein n=1 Tax=Pseudomonas ficuserectae TaxID=53410 RepID=A0ABV4PNQ5_9PSED|nr:MULTISPECIES: FlgT C-terminal domain-containing protein [Pseudomonas syringae group]KEZ25371.1 hypothetical protein A3SK_0121420 [Pseudomonas amygdali pv. tabaci str. 6605]MDU8604796.1 FlgT C-terminal domain-containing protein [Pseudomonas syringae group sp. 247E2]MDU8629863.1 FlgT C-terminal domain-containing protein [Pseudomonas syringae group sp. 243L2]MDU8646019.1 FlgT C-terminal domain-containing protein [Pseudomonas syringae group sp. 26L6]QOI06675.1 hypothetical protein D5S10_24240 [